MLSVALVVAGTMVDVSDAHQAPVHTHQQLVPIPKYRARSGQVVVSLAQRLITSFDAKAQQAFLFDWDAGERTEWSNLPAGFFTRPGISIGEMSDAQRALLFDFLSASLGEKGYGRLTDVLAAEAFLSQAPGAERNGWFPENYWISFYGTPSGRDLWGWSFGGHHLALNISFNKGQISTISPSFVGTEPAIFRLDGAEYEAVVDMHRAGHAVYQTLDDDQKEQADAGSVPGDVQAGPGDDGYIPHRIGMSASEMSAPQRAALLNAIQMWVEIQPERNAAARMQEIEAQLDQVHFAWRGTDEVNTPVYMRIQGPTLIIELVSTGGNVGRNARGLGHYHTIYRDPTYEYGRR
ncbi:hypothetical protein DEM27_26200 [Metarhizobium album]|uniref:DUF3500 domain-containing protein n=1 Tax=Metarhizobium album TaxID=2182425 RepID=A0A2U2DJL5_9HYPH|nr:hypothetical protein DEM27_26200 [Rhizobium album]